MYSRFAAILIVVGSLFNAAASSQIVGTTLRYQDFKEFVGADAKSLHEFQGRLVLLEFFAYW